MKLKTANTMVDTSICVEPMLFNIRPRVNRLSNTPGTRYQRLVTKYLFS